MHELDAIAAIATDNVIPVFADGIVMSGSAQKDRIIVFYERQLSPLPTMAEIINDHANP